MPKLLTKTVNTLEITFYVGETATDADAGVTLDVDHLNGTSIVSGAAATDEAETGRYTYDLAAQDDPAVVKVTWYATIGGNARESIQWYEIVDGLLFSLIVLRSQSGLSNTSTYTTDELEAARDQVIDTFQEFCETAWAGTYRRQILDGDGDSVLFLDRMPVQRLLSVSVDGTSLTLSDLTVSRDGEVRIKSGTPASFLTTDPQNVIVEYVYGEDFVPSDIYRAALRYGRYLTLSETSSIPDRARMLTTQYGSFQMVVANEDYPTGLPEVDSVLRRHRRDLFGFS